LGAATISTDEDYAVLVGALHKKPFQTNVKISFDLDSMAPFKIRMKWVSFIISNCIWITPDFVVGTSS
jgi:hypothetical protein